MRCPLQTKRTEPSLAITVKLNRSTALAALPALSVRGAAIADEANVQNSRQPRPRFRRSEDLAPNLNPEGGRCLERFHRHAQLLHPDVPHRLCRGRGISPSVPVRRSNKTTPGTASVWSSR